MNVFLNRLIDGAPAGIAGDIVLIAGRGHELTQTFPDGSVIDFDDVAEARAAVRRVLATYPGK